MAVVQGVRERVHLPIYDALKVEPNEQLRDVAGNGVLKFFMDVQGKTKLETNLQSASLLPHYNTFEARALRVVISDLPPEMGKEDIKDGGSEGLWVSDDEDQRFNDDGTPFDPAAGAGPVSATLFDFSHAELVGLLKDAMSSEDGDTFLYPDEDGVTIVQSDGTELDPEVPADKAIIDTIIDAGGVVWLSESEIRDMLDELGGEQLLPPDEQLSSGNGHGTLIGKFIYNTVTTLFVGEKVMIQMPTWFFPSGAGASSETASHVSHGEPSPLATFRFAEPIHIDKQQNFRVEIEIPDNDTVKEFQRLYGPLFIWVVLDGYMTRDVQ